MQLLELEFMDDRFLQLLTKSTILRERIYINMQRKSLSKVIEFLIGSFF